MHSFFDNKLKFILSTLFGISTDDSDDLYTIMPAIDKGNIIHKMMEGFELKKSNRNEFINNAMRLYDNFIKMRPAVIKAQLDIDRTRFLSDIENLYDMDPGNKHIASEKLMIGQIGKIKFKIIGERNMSKLIRCFHR